MTCEPFPLIADQRSKITHLLPLSFLVAEADENRFLILSMPVTGSSRRLVEEMDELRPYDESSRYLK